MIYYLAGMVTDLGKKVINNFLLEEEQKWLDAKWNEVQDKFLEFSINELRFVYAEAEKIVNAQVESADLATQKSLNLITISLGIITGLIGFAFARFEKHEELCDPLLITALIILCYLGSVCYDLYKIYKGLGIKQGGAIPKDFVTEHFLNPKFSQPEGVLEKELIITMIVSYQNRIVSNHTINKQRWSKFDSAFREFSLTPLICVMLYIILSASHYFLGTCLHLLLYLVLQSHTIFG